MNKKIRLTENELVEIVGRVILETERKLKRGSTNKVLRRPDNEQSLLEVYRKCRRLAVQLSLISDDISRGYGQKVEYVERDVREIYKIINDIEKIIWVCESTKPNESKPNLEYLKNSCVEIFKSFPNYDYDDIEKLLQDCYELISYILD